MPRDPLAADHVQRQRAGLCATETDAFVQLCADMLAGLKPDLTFIVSPTIRTGHNKATHAAVCDVMMALSPKACKHMEKGDDRLMGIAETFLPCVLLSCTTHEMTPACQSTAAHATAVPPHTA